MKTATIFLTVVSAFAQVAKAPSTPYANGNEPATPKVPVIPIEHELEFSNAHNAVSELQLALNNAQKRSNDAFSVLKEDCRGLPIGQDPKTLRFYCVFKEDPKKDETKK